MGASETSAGRENASGRLVVGLVRGLHGLDGAVRVEVLTDHGSRFRAGSRLYPEGSQRALVVSWVQPDAPGLLVRFRQITSREAAELLRGTYLEADRPADGLPAGAVYWHEVIGVPVATSTGEGLGSVADVFRTGENEVFVVTGGRRGELLVPAVRSVVIEFAPAEGRIVVDADALGLEEMMPRRARGRRSSRLPRGSLPAAGAASEPPPVGSATAHDPSRGAAVGDGGSSSG